MTSQNQIRFQVETDKVLSIISNEIYDSPYALLRENVQNAYDAILMRDKEDNTFSLNDAVISVIMGDHDVVITDNGIGMTESVLRNNYWKAGSSGKNTESARKAGVIGTFGIGAMANFGVCRLLKVETKYFDSGIGYITSAAKSNLDINKECVDFESNHSELNIGTKITALLDLDKRLTVANAINYLKQFVQFLPIKVYFNDELVSMKDYKMNIIPNTEMVKQIKSINVTHSDTEFIVNFCWTSSNRAFIEIYNICYQNATVNGEIVLLQGNQSIMGFRNYFGLAPIPINTIYQFGGIANLDMLQPTAGREAVSRESLAILANIISIAELYISKEISAHSFADNNSSFSNFIVATKRWDLAENITIDVFPGPRKITLGAVNSLANIRYYKGRESSIIETFSSGDQALLVLSQNNPRRNIQLNYIQTVLQCAEVPDSVNVIRVYTLSELSNQEFSFVIKVASILQEDYLLQDLEVKFADISHGVPFWVQCNNSKLALFISKSFPGLIPVLKCYDTAYDVFSGFVKDFVRVHIYEIIRNYIPSATKDGIDVLQNKLRRKRELYRLEYEDVGKIDSLLSDYLAGKATFSEVLSASSYVTKANIETVAKESISKVESEIPDLVESPVSEAINQNIDNGIPEYPALPSIRREESTTQSKVLTVDKRLPQLHNFVLFLSVSQRLFDRDRDFFIDPHQTKIIWGSHRIVYIFLSSRTNFTLYYDIELKEPLVGNSVGGKCIPSTTIITKDKIFIPVIDEAISAFQIIDNPKEFVVRYDYIY